MAYISTVKGKGYRGWESPGGKKAGVAAGELK
jgi:hypothetical protein